MSDEYIKRENALSIVNEPWDKNCGISRIEYVRIRLGNLPPVDVVDKTAYDQLLAENTKLKKQVSDLRYKIYAMKDDSWEEDYRRGQVQGMW